MKQRRYDLIGQRFGRGTVIAKIGNDKNGCTINRFSGEYIYNGIDRIDSTKGYVIGNLCTCCKTCNFAKRNMTKSDFLCWVERVYQYSVKQTSKSLVDVEVE